MAVVTRRYLFKGPAPQTLKAETDPALVLPAPKFAVTFDVTFDNAVDPQMDMDKCMSTFGCFPDTQDTIILAPDPFLGLFSPNGEIWRLQVSDIGILTVDQVS